MRCSHGNRLWILVPLAVCFVAGVTVRADATDRKKVYPPNEVQPRDPDLSRVLDEELKNLYLETIVTMRTLRWDGYRWSFEKHKDSELYQYMRSSSRSAAEISTIVSGGAAALQETPVNWSAYRAALWVTRAGFYSDSSFVPIARAALQSPRGEKLSDAHVFAIDETLECVASYSTPESTALLEECATSEFWQRGGPIRGNVRGSSIHTDSELSEIRLRMKSVHELVRLTDFELVLPALESLIRQYPDLGEGVASTKGRKVIINTLPEGFGYALRNRLKNLKQREGLAPE